LQTGDRRNKQKERIRTWKLKGDNVEIFRHEVQSRISVSQEVTWNKLKSSIMESARKVCGITRGQKRKERETWWRAEEVQEAVKAKKGNFQELADRSSKCCHEFVVQISMQKGKESSD